MREREREREREMQSRATRVTVLRTAALMILKFENPLESLVLLSPTKMLNFLVKCAMKSQNYSQQWFLSFRCLLDCLCLSLSISASL